MLLFHPLSVFRFFQFTVNNQVKEISTALFILILAFLCYLTYKDLKPSNIAVNEDCELKVSCFFCMFIIHVGLILRSPLAIKRYFGTFLPQ